MDILVVDDDEGHVELITRNLRRAGFSNTIIPLYDGQDALDYVYYRGKHVDRQRKAPLLMLLDLNMPGIRGEEVLETIKSDPQKKKMPIIVLTTTDDPREIERCYELGCSVYVTKPVEPERFIEAIRRLGLFVAVVSMPPETES